MTDKERAKLYPVILREYNTAWPEWFADEKSNLEQLIGSENIARISHFGSTSVPGLAAKPTIDILLEINESAGIDELIAALAPPDYICLNEAALTIPTPPPHLMFIKGYLADGFAERVYHIHVRYPGDWDELLFRDYLITHPETAAEYAELKRRLIQDYEYDRDGYTRSKTDFIRAVINKAKGNVQTMEQSINIMTSRIASILCANKPSIFLFGSVVFDDFRLGWSDIDFICLTEKSISTEQADELVNLRQTLLAGYPGNRYFRLFEGIMMTREAFLENSEDTVVYWGTSGQRVTKAFQLCPFSTIELIENGKLLYGSDFRNQMSYPTRAEIITAIKNHCETIRQHGKSGSGWLLDIARCLYTLRTNKIITKTKAGEWAIHEKICPDISILERAVAIRKNPLELRKDDEVQNWEQSLEWHIQQFADVLAAELCEETRF